MEQRVLRSLTNPRLILRWTLPPSTFSSPIKQAHVRRQTGQYRPGYFQARTFISTACLWRNDGGASVEGLSREGETSRKTVAEDALAQEKGKQIRAPWHRDESTLPPVARLQSAGPTKKGKVLTTPSRLLKIIVPLTTLEQNADSKDIQPLALLVHPQQPLSYLERLIQSELPTIKTKNGDEKIPTVHFRAEDSQQDKSIPPGRTSHEETDKEKSDEETNDGLEETRIGKKTERTGKLISRASKPDVVQALGDGGVESYSGLGHEKVSPKGEKRKFVRWSSSTEIGDFIRDAARGKEFIIDIEGADRETRVDVPSFNDRTHYLRSRLRKTASQILSMEQVKRECDVAAHKSAQRVAMGGAGLLVGYWYIVYRITFETDLGWDTMEPVTYLVGLSTLICGYLWFLYHNREVSYRSALNLTISRRRQKLYQTRGFDLPKWEALVEEGNALRREIKTVAREYDVDWDETVDEKHERVKEVLREDREEKKEKRKEKGKGKEGGEGEEDGKGAEEED